MYHYKLLRKEDCYLASDTLKIWMTCQANWLQLTWNSFHSVCQRLFLTQDDDVEVNSSHDGRCRNFNWSVRQTVWKLLANQLVSETCKITDDNAFKFKKSDDGRFKTAGKSVSETYEDGRFVNATKKLIARRTFQNYWQTWFQKRAKTDVKAGSEDQGVLQSLGFNPTLALSFDEKQLKLKAEAAMRPAVLLENLEGPPQLLTRLRGQQWLLDMEPSPRYVLSNGRGLNGRFFVGFGRLGNQKTPPEVDWSHDRTMPQQWMRVEQPFKPS